MLVSRGLKVWGSMALASLVLAGCGTRLSKAPVEDRGTSAGMAVSQSGMVVSDKPLPGAENAGKPGYYSVKPGDTLIRIGLETGQSWKDIARWNNLENANLIEVGQVLRVVPPSLIDGPATVSSRPVVTTVIAPGTATSSSNGVSKPSSAMSTSSTSKPAPSVAASGADDDLGFIWPANGTLLAGFDEARNKGYDISGKAGDPVLAAADGRVVYAGAGLRGYGNLIILKHNNTFLTAYAHNQALLVKEDQSVRKGQKIAEMGNTDADRVKLHFEIRRQGKPVDPSRYLPAR